MWITQDLMVIAWKPLVQSQDSNILSKSFYFTNASVFLMYQSNFWSLLQLEMPGTALCLVNYNLWR